MMLTSFNRSAAFSNKVEMANRTNISLTVPGGHYSLIYETFGYLTIATGVVGVASSILCMWNILKTRTRQKSSSNILFLNLCVTTFLFGIIVCPIHAYTQIAQSGNVLTRQSALRPCQFIAFTYFLTFTASAYSHSAIAVNRLLAVVFHDSRCHSEWVTGMLIALTWLIPGGTFLPPLFDVGASFGFSEESMKCTFDSLKVRTYVVMFKVMYGFVPFIIMSVCYAGVFAKVVLSSRRIRTRQRIAAADPGKTGQLVQTIRKRRAISGEVRVTKIAFTTCLGFASCFIPSAVYGFVVKTREEIQSPLGIGLVSLMWIGSALNPLLYTYLNSSLRSKIMDWLSHKTSVGSWLRESHGSTEMTSKGQDGLERRGLSRQTEDL